MDLYQLPEQSNKNYCEPDSLETTADTQKEKKSVPEMGAQRSSNRIQAAQGCLQPPHQLTGLRSSDTCAVTREMPDTLMQQLCIPVLALSFLHLPTPTSPCVATAMGLDLISRL